MSVTRYETQIEDEVLYIEYEDRLLEIGSVEAIVDLMGGETYTLEYTKKQASAAWLNTDENNTIDVNVREAIESMSYQRDFITNLANCSLDENGDAGYPKRTELYADLMTHILESKGNIED